MGQGEISTNLDRIYEYILHLLIRANIEKSTELLDQSINHMTEMRDTWKDAFEKEAAERPNAKPRLDPHGASALNLQG